MTEPIPSLPEQTKIAGFLSALDGKIGAVGEQMRQKQAWKKGLRAADVCVRAGLI